MIYIYRSDLVMKLCDSFGVTIPLSMVYSFPILVVDGELVGCISFKKLLPGEFHEALVKECKEKHSKYE